MCPCGSERNEIKELEHFIEIEILEELEKD